MFEDKAVLILFPFWLIAILKPIVRKSGLDFLERWYGLDNPVQLEYGIYFLLFFSYPVYILLPLVLRRLLLAAKDPSVKQIVFFFESVTLH